MHVLYSVKCAAKANKENHLKTFHIQILIDNRISSQTHATEYWYVINMKGHMWKDLESTLKAGHLW